MILAIIVIAMAALLVTMLFFAGLRASRKLEDRTANVEAFARIHAAIAQFVQVNRRLPCPANGTLANGLENPVGGATDCPTPAGPVPWATLGLPALAARDSHGRLFSYRVYDAATGFTRANGLVLTDCLDQDTTSVLALAGTACDATTHDNTRSDFFSGKGLTVDDRGVSKPQIAYVLMSHGASGYGAHLPDPSVTMPAPTAGSKEAINASDSPTYWIVEENEAVDPGNVGHFDDHLSYVNVTDLVVGAQLGGRPWPIAGRLDRANWAPNTVGYILLGSSTATSGDGVTISAMPSATRWVCAANTATEGIVPCDVVNRVLDSWLGNERLNNEDDERLVFDFRASRRYLKVKLANFSSATPEQVRLTFYDGATQVFDVTKAACGTGDHFAVDPGATFTRVEVRAGSAASSFSISSLSGCRLSDAVYCTLREAASPTPCP